MFTPAEIGMVRCFPSAWYGELIAGLGIRNMKVKQVYFKKAVFACDDSGLS